MHVKKGDKVQVIAGKDKGRQGLILQVLPKQNKVVVEGINVVKKHQKASQQNEVGGIVEIEAPIHASNVQPLCPKTKKPTRVGYEVRNGKKVRIAKVSGEVLDK
ncbi:50S ribosomal protein L24 [Culicoidibacter larvae]|uniref:Large ribosomal subunit protein uL24 n=1 Tax=Culicoidibacter larvae TaxID=2579976 RepID=A0A5R8QHE4_9FIRM|nr:50S ribosomal protein L24 [Culicoidibacter larvae]TLG77428.1 50S ribosomal protein L24 [Culicoidibacter larvae]